MMCDFSPYWGKSFGEFFVVFALRFLKWLSGDLSLADLASDEIQILVLILIALSSSLIGVFLVLRKMTMLANSLSHTLLLGVVLTYLMLQPVEAHFFQTLNLKTLFIASLITAILTTFFTEFLHKVMKLQEDASIGLVFTTFFALGVILITLFTKNAHIGTEAIMGNVDALHLHDLKLACVLFFINLSGVAILFRVLFISTFDPILARNFGIPTLLLNYLLMFQTAATAIGSFRAVGVFLFLALLVGPTLIARFFTYRLPILILLSCAIGALSSFVAVALSRHILSSYDIALSTSGLVAFIIALLYLLAWGVKTVSKQVEFRLTKSRALN